jgi:hypothetical protein
MRPRRKRLIASVGSETARETVPAIRDVQAVQQHQSRDQEFPAGDAEQAADDSDR